VPFENFSERFYQDLGLSRSHDYDFAPMFVPVGAKDLGFKQILHMSPTSPFAGLQRVLNDIHT